jgi:hypothetical protein
VKVAPPLGGLAATMVPLWAAVSSATTARPMPVPARPLAVLPRQNRSKMCGRSPGGMPGPVSVTVSSALTPTGRVVRVTCPPGGGELGRVRQQVGDDLGEAGLVGVHHGRAGVHVQAHLGVLELSLEFGCRVSSDLGEVDRGEIQGERGGLRGREGGQVIDEPFQAEHLVMQ